MDHTTIHEIVKSTFRYQSGVNLSSYDMHAHQCGHHPIASSNLNSRSPDYCHAFLRTLHYTPETPPTHTWLSLEIFHHSFQCCLFLSIIETHSKRLPGCIRHGSDKIPKHRFLAPTPLAWHSEVVEATPVVNTFNSSGDIGEGEGRVCREGRKRNQRNCV